MGVIVRSEGAPRARRKEEGEMCRRAVGFRSLLRWEGSEVDEAGR